MSIASLQAAITTAGGTPTSASAVGLYKELLTATGGNPVHHDIITLLRDIIAQKGGTPTQFSYVGLLRQLITTLGGTATSFVPDALEAQMATLISFNPALLFALGESGAWYDTSDLTTMSQDSAGVTPAVVGQPVGLLLDKRLGLVRGAELKATGTTLQIGTSAAATYDTSTGQGSMNRVDVSNQSQVRFLGLTSGQTYEMRIANTGASSVSVRTNTGATTITNIASGVTQTFFAQVTGSDITLQGAADGTTMAFTVVAIKALPGNHATQATTAAKPVLRQHYDRIGSEFVSNGTFNTDATGWAVVSGATLSATGGEFSVVSTSTSTQGGQQTISGLTIGKTYELSGSARRVSGTGSARLGVQGKGESVVTSATATPYSLIFTATATSHIVSANISTPAAAGEEVRFDNISVKEATAWRNVGPELVANGGFDSDTAWTKGSGVTISGGTLNFDGATSFISADQSRDLTNDAYYTVTYTVTRTSGGVRVLLYANGKVGIGAFRTASGTYTETVRIDTTTGSATDVVRVQSYDNATNFFVGSVDNVTIKEVSDNVGYYLEFDGVDDYLTLTPTLYAAGSSTVMMAVNGAAQADKKLYSEGHSTNTNAGYVPVLSGPVDTSALSSFIRDDAATVRVAQEALKVTGVFNGTNVIVETRDTGSLLRHRRNNGAEVSLGYTRGATTLDRAAIGAYLRNTASGNFAGRFYGTVMIGRALTDAETTSARTYLASKSGVTL